VKKIDKIKRLMNIITILETYPGKIPSRSSLSSYMDESQYIPFCVEVPCPKSLCRETKEGIMRTRERYE
jgi:hypothetical protein